MKNFVFTTLAVVIVTIFAAASFAQAQSGSGIGWNVTPQASPQPNHILPAPNPGYPGYGSGQTGTSRPNGWYGTTGSYGNSGTTAGYRAGYGATGGSGLGSVLGSWFGLRPASQTPCANGRCRTYPVSPPYHGSAPYWGASTGTYSSPNSVNYGIGTGSGAFYSSY